MPATGGSDLLKGGGGRPSRASRPSRRPRKPPAAVFGSLAPADRPITQAQRVAHRRVERAQVRLPQRPLPAIPTLAHPTQRQARTAIRLGQRSIQRQVPRNLPPAERARRIVGIQQEVRQDPRERARVAPIFAAQAKLTNDHRVRMGLADIRHNPHVYGVTGDDVAHLHHLAMHGALPDAARTELAKIGRSLEVPGVRAKAGPGDRRVRLPLGVATINVDALRRTVMGATSLDTGDLGPREFVRHSLADLGTIGTAPILGGYQLAAGATEALLHGRPQRLENIGKGLVEGVKQEVTHPDQAFRQHPLLTALDVAGLVTGVGRVAGAAARVGTAGRLASTVRSPLALSEDAGAVAAGLRHDRTFSKDLSRRGLQQLADARREPLRDAQGKVVTVTDRGREVPVLKATPAERERLLRRRGNVVAARGDAANRMARAQATRTGQVRGVRGAAARDIVQMATEGTITAPEHFERDLRAHAKRLDREYAQRMEADPVGFRQTVEAQANRDRRALIERVVSSPRAMRQGQAIVAHGIEHGRVLREGDVASIERELIDPAAAHRSPLITVAVEHMGARHFTVEQHRRLERAALGRERAAAERVRTTAGAERDQAVAALNAARAERIAVSGRHPVGVRAQEEAQARVTRAEQAVKQARAEHLQAHNDLKRLQGAQSVQRGGEAARRMEIASRGGRRSQNVLRYIDEVSGDERRLLRGAAQERRMERRRTAAQQRLARTSDRRRRAEAALRRERHRLREAPMPETRAGLRTARGHFLSNKTIEDFLRSRGRDPRTVAYVPHRLSIDRRSFYRRFAPGSRPSLEGGGTRTGAAYRKGATLSSAELLREAHVRQATSLARAEQVDQLVAEHGVRHPVWSKASRGQQLTRAEQRIVDRGGYFTGPEAAETIDRLRADTGEEWVAVRAFSGRLSAETQRVIRDELQGPGGMDSLGQRLLNDRIVSPEELGQSGTRNVVLMPHALVDQMERHLRPAGELERMAQMLNRPFAMSVLPQPRWLAGNFIEPYLIRLPGIGSGAVNVFGLGMDIAAGLKVLRQMRKGSRAEREAAARIEAHQLGGLLFGRRQSVFRTRDDVRAYAHLVRRLPAVDQFTDLVSGGARVATAPLRGVFAANRVLIERPAQLAAFGRSARRDVQEFSGKWTQTILLGQRAVDEVKRGLIGTPTQERFMRFQHELLGQYEGYPPTIRRLLQSVFPFAAWSLSAARFTYWTMPLHRTAQTALLIKTQDVVAKQWADEHKDVPPGSLRTAARTKDGGFVDFARYTPYGFSAPIIEGDPSGVTDQFMPQASGFAAALSGLDPFGRPLQVPRTPSNPKGTPSLGQKVGAGFNSLAEGFVPYLSTLRRLREHGETPLSTSTAWSPKTKPGTSHGMSALRRTFDPFRPTYLRAAGGTARPVPGGRSSPQQQLLERAAERNANGGLSDAQLRLLERAAERAGG